jgi:hypothetical protein
VIRSGFTRTVALLLLTAAGGCTSLTGQSTADQAILLQEVQTACLYTPIFKQVNGIITLAVPAATIPADFVDAGLTIVCTDPAFTAKIDANTADWVMKVIHDHQAG